MGCVILDWPVSINDHTRPEVEGVSKRMWRIYAFAESLLEILLWRDGRTMETTTLYVEEYKTCDGTARHGMRFPDDAWQVQVLRDAGYTLVTCPESIPSMPYNNPNPYASPIQYDGRKVTP